MQYFSRIVKYLTNTVELFNAKNNEVDICTDDSSIQVADDAGAWFGLGSCYSFLRQNSAAHRALSRAADLVLHCTVHHHNCAVLLVQRSLYCITLLCCVSQLRHEIPVSD